MSSTTSKRLKRVWGIVESAAETGAHSISIAYLEAALNGGEKWAKLEALAAEAPLPPEEYRALYFQTLEEASASNGQVNIPEKTPDEYVRWYDSELARIEFAEEAILSAPDVVL